LVETLKGSTGEASLFELLEPVFDNLQTYLKLLGKETKNTGKLKASSFFFTALTILLILTLGDKWAEHNSVEM
jgi:hypothetical protein